MPIGAALSAGCGAVLCWLCPVPTIPTIPIEQALGKGTYGQPDQDVPASRQRHHTELARALLDVNEVDMTSVTKRIRLRWAHHFGSTTSGSQQLTQIVTVAKAWPAGASGRAAAAGRRLSQHLFSEDEGVIVGDGHYVYFYKDEDGWVRIDNHEVTSVRTSLVQTESERHGYVFVYQEQ